MKFLKDVDPVITLGIGLVGGIAYVYTTFATITYVKELHTEAINHSDQNRAAMSLAIDQQKGILTEINDRIKQLDARSYADREYHNRKQ